MLRFLMQRPRERMRCVSDRVNIFPVDSDGGWIESATAGHFHGPVSGGGRGAAVHGESLPDGHGDDSHRGTEYGPMADHHLPARCPNN